MLSVYNKKEIVYLKFELDNKKEIVYLKFELEEFFSNALHNVPYKYNNFTTIFDLISFY